jgi:hypothetical protein
MQNRVKIVSDSTILPPSPKHIIKPNNVSEPIQIVERRKIQCANPIFDPNNASPTSEFMNVLKLRMNIYYEPELNIFDTK